MARARKLEDTYGRRFGFSEVAQLIKLVYRIHHFRIEFQDQDRRFGGFPTSNKVGKRNRYIIRGDWNRTEYQVRNVRRDYKYKIPVLPENQEAEDNLNFYFLRLGDICVYDIRRHDTIVDKTFKWEKITKLVRNQEREKEEEVPINVGGSGDLIDEGSSDDETLAVRKEKNSRKKKEVEKEVIATKRQRFETYETSSESGGFYIPVIRNKEISGGDSGMVPVNEGVSATNKFDGNSDEWEKGEMESAAGNEQVLVAEAAACGRTVSKTTCDNGYMQSSVEKFPKDNAAELSTGRGENGQHVDSGMQLRSKRKIVQKGAAEQGSVRQGEEVIPGNIGELHVGKNAKGIAAEQGEVNVSLAKGESAGKGIASGIAEVISKGTAAGQAAKAFAGRPVHNSEAESVHKCAASQGNHGLNMGQFANEIAAGFKEKVSSLAAGQVAKAVAGKTFNDAAAGNGKQGLTMGHLAKSFAAGQGCVGLDERQGSMEAAAGQRCKVAPADYRQHDVGKKDKEAAAGDGIPGRFGELGAGEGKTAKEAAAGDGQHGQYAKEVAAGDGQHGRYAKEAAAGDGQHGRYAKEAAVGDGQHGQYANEAAGKFENEANFAEWMGNEQEVVNLIFAEGITAAELPSSRPIGIEQHGAEKTAAAGLFGAANTTAELPATPKTAEKMPRQVDVERGQRVESDGGSSFEQENTTTNDKTTTNKMKGATDTKRENVVKQAIAKHEKEINGFRKQVMSLEAENAHLKAKNEEIRKVGLDAVQWCKTTKPKYEKTLNDLRNVVKEREALNDQMYKMKKEKEAMEAEMQSLEEERAMTRTRCFEWKAAHDKMKVMHERAVEVRAQTNREVIIIQGNLDKLTKELNNVRHNYAVLYNSCKSQGMKDFERAPISHSFGVKPNIDKSLPPPPPPM
ncbi:hypothetical protein FRX31_024396 [Thalictrum thalictroides]|uniref:Uncharacterized protein n=1 Tax=Thalictrum thalictroides TaxID=46969 RepID=A0A7J6VLL1_THATH|nr:hypothetical protein FRX31_024396 [Thalictrum thalictroides]